MRTKRASSTPTPVIDDDDDYDVPDILQRSSMMGTGSSSTGHASVDTGPAPSTRKTTKKVFEPSKEVLMIEMRLTTDEMENAVYLKEMFDVIKKRMKFENSKDSPEVIAADWHSVASHLFHSAHRTTKDQKYDRKTKRNWYLCEDEKTMRKHPNIKKKSCFFYVAKYVPTSQPRIQLFQGGTEVEGPVMKKDWDMSDRKARSDFVFSEGGTKKRGKAKAGQLPETLVRKDLIHALGKAKGSARGRGSSYRKKMAARAEVWKEKGAHPLSNCVLAQRNFLRSSVKRSARNSR